MANPPHIQAWLNSVPEGDEEETAEQEESGGSDYGARAVVVRLKNGVRLIDREATAPRIKMKPKRLDAILTGAAEPVLHEFVLIAEYVLNMTLDDFCVWWFERRREYAKGQAMRQSGSEA